MGVSHHTPEHPPPPTILSFEIERSLAVLLIRPVLGWEVLAEAQSKVFILIRVARSRLTRGSVRAAGVHDAQISSSRGVVHFERLKIDKLPGETNLDEDTNLTVENEQRTFSCITSRRKGTRWTNSDTWLASEPGTFDSSQATEIQIPIRNEHFARRTREKITIKVFWWKTEP
ncbi:hypothetical protein EVAR_23976_1 [Eumeta japonica]|uniref:Uncharacterized protein n=1 Tax=Eumeta variegata TaxID=151549 RepID=A0A4C1V399_EUMVA|nr:hypothetical protein EVAR_23976_1 [Eumeta japonica]